MLNRFIDFSIKGANNISYHCPRSGMRPDISLKCSLIRGSVATQVELSVANLVLPFSASHTDKMSVTFGYSDETPCTIEGSLVNSYTQQDGATLVSRFSMLHAMMPLDTSNNAVSVQARKGETVTTVLKKLYKNAGLPYSPQTFLGKLPYDVSFTGTLGEALGKLSEMVNTDIPGIRLVIQNGYAYATLASVLKANPVELKYLCASPSFSGGTLKALTPFTTAINPGTVIRLSPKYFETGKAVFLNSTSRGLLFEVVKSDVTFSTYGNDSGVALLAAKVG